MKAALTALLLADPDLQALVGDRIHWGRAPAHVTAFPYLNLTLVTDPARYTLEGEAEVHATVVQVDGWAQTAVAVEGLRWAVRGLLSGYRGTRDGIRFRGAFVAGSRDLDGRSLGDLDGLFGASVDLNIKWSRA